MIALGRVSVLSWIIAIAILSMTDVQSQNDATAQSGVRDPDGLDLPADPNSRLMDCLHSWSDRILIKHERNVPLRSFMDHALLSAMPRGNRYLNVPLEHRAHAFSPAELAFVASASQKAIPLLVDLVSNETMTPWSFSYPPSSHIDPRRWMVGEIACYMIEVALRDDIYFTRTGFPGRCGEPDVSAYPQCGEWDTGTWDKPSECRKNTLRLMANEYRRWYARCFDQEKLIIICSERDLPSVPWNYDPTASDAYLRLINSDPK